jgi:dienelactone hydrolase
LKTRSSGTQRAIEILVGARTLNAFLNIPDNASAVVLFALRSGRGRFRLRNQFVSSVLHRASIATLLLDLLDEQEADIRAKLFDVHLLARRLEAATAYLSDKDELLGLPFGYFGVSTGAAAALVAAPDREKEIKAIVSCGGRPDLAADSLPLVQAATLLIVGGEDKRLIELNHRALARLSSVKELKIIPGVAHSYPEAALKEIGQLTTRWFQAHLCNNPTPVEQTSESARPGGDYVC